MFAGQVLPENIFLFIAEIFLCLIGLWSALLLNKNFTVLPVPVKNSVLIKTGLYKYVRHPIYTVVILLCLIWIGEEFSVLNFIVWLALTAVLIYKLNYEERLLSAKFKDYKSYQAVSKKLIPFILIKYFFKIFVLCSAVIFYSCSKSDEIIVSTIDTSTNFKYPYSLNSNWFFSTTPNYAFYPDSIRRYFSDIDSSAETGYAIWKNDTLINGVNARVLKTNHTSPNHSYNASETYIQTDSGLINLSYDTDVSFGPYRPNPSSGFFYKNKKYYSLNDFRREVFNTPFSNSDSVFSPVNSIKYPMIINDEWFFKNLSAIQAQKKKYLGYEQVQTLMGVYNCMVIQRINYESGVKDTNFIHYDYFAKIGMVKRTRKIKNIPFHHPITGKLIGYFDVGQEVILNSANIFP